MDFIEIAKPGHLGYSEDIIQESNTLLDDNAEYLVIAEENDGYIIYSEKPEEDKKSAKKAKKVQKTSKKGKKAPLKELFQLQLHISGLSDHVEYIIMDKLAYPIAGKEADKLLVRIETLLSQQRAKNNFNQVQAKQQETFQLTKLRSW